MSKDFLPKLQSLVHSLADRPSWDEYFMATALLVSARSACSRLKVGCILVSGGDHPHRIIAAGYNGFLPGSPHISRVRDDHEQATIHAEQNAVTDAARRGVTVSGASAYITHFPCVHCVKILIAAGVKSIVYHSDYKNDPIVLELLNESKTTVRQL